VATLQLVKTVPFLIGAEPETERRIGNAMIQFLNPWRANWGGVSFQMCNNIHSASNHDCVVYLVNSWNSGVIRAQNPGTLPLSVRKELQVLGLADMASSLNTSGPLGLTQTNAPAISEVYVSRCRSFALELRASANHIEGDALQNFAYVMAHVAVHEMMHNKIDAFAPGQTIHNFQNGRFSGPINADHMRRRQPPNANDDTRIRQHFASHKQQFIFTRTVTGFWQSPLYT